MLVRKLTAHCDKDGCECVKALDPDTSQPFRDLVKDRWSVDEQTRTFCPGHDPRGPQ